MRKQGTDWVVFGQLEFEAETLDLWRGEVGDRMVALLEFEQQTEEELLRLDFAPGLLRVRAWMHAASFQSWAPRLEALFASAARAGASGEVVFTDGHGGRAQRLRIFGGRAAIDRVPPPDADHPALREVARLVEERAAAALEKRESQRSGHPSQTSGR